MPDIDIALIFTSVDYTAVLAAGVAGFVIGAVWCSLLGRHWTAALGAARPRPHKPAYRFAATAFGANMLMALMLYGMMLHSGGMSAFGGVFAAVLVWLGFVVTTVTVNHAFQRCTRMLTVIECGHWLCVLVVQGALMGALA